MIWLSATMPTDVLEVSESFMSKPLRILVRPKEESHLEGVKQFFFYVVAIKFVTTGEEKKALRDIEKLFNTHIDEMPMNVANLI